MVLSVWFPTALFPTTWCASKSRVLPLPSFQHDPSWTVPPFMCLFQCDTPILHSIKVPISPNTSKAKTVYAPPWCEFCMCWPVQWYVVITVDIQGDKLLHWVQPRISPPHASWMCRKRGSWGFLPSVNCHRQRAVAFSPDFSPSGINLGVTSGSNSL